MDLPTLDDVKDGVDTTTDTVREHGRELLPWLPDPPTCDCGAMMYASETFDPSQAMYVNSWECRNCDAPDRYRDDPDVPDPKPPRSGAPALRETLNDEY